MGPLRPHMMCPRPRYLSHWASYQLNAILFSVDNFFQSLHYGYKFPLSMVRGKAIVAAITTHFYNLGIDCPHLPTDMQQDPTPEEVVDYMKKLLQSGKTWDAGVRVYASMHYRGTLLFACTLLWMGQHALAYEAQKWANDFI